MCGAVLELHKFFWGYCEPNRSLLVYSFPAGQKLFFLSANYISPWEMTLLQPCSGPSTLYTSISPNLHSSLSPWRRSLGIPSVSVPTVHGPCLGCGWLRHRIPVASPLRYLLQCSGSLKEPVHLRGIEEEKNRADLILNPGLKINRCLGHKF